MMGNLSGFLRGLLFAGFGVAAVFGPAAGFAAGGTPEGAAAGVKAGGAGAFDWPRYLGPECSGISKETGWQTKWPADGPKQVWKKNVGFGFATVSVANGRVYTSGYDESEDKDRLFCFDAGTGTELWRHAYSTERHDVQHEGGPCATPTVDANRVYTFGKQGDLFCVDTDKHGEVVWHKNVKQALGAEVPRWGLSGSPLVEGRLLIVEADFTAGFDKMTGEVVWKSDESFGAGYSSPVAFDLDPRRAVAVFNAYGLVVFNAQYGKEIFRHRWDTRYDVNAAMPLVRGDQVFISSNYNKGCAMLKIENNAAKVLWENRNMRNHFNTCIWWKDHLYGFDDATLACLDAKTGEATWQERGLGKGSVMMADGKLIVLSEKGELMVAEADPAAFKPISRAQVIGGKCWTVPVLSNGRIYCRNAEGDLVCLDVRGS